MAESVGFKMTERRAPKGKFRIIGVDTYDGTDWVYDDLDDLESAKDFADKKGGEMLKTHVYDDNGDNKYSAGIF